LGVSLAGGETRTDWRRRPLTAAQVQYALDDVRYLLDLADHFAERLEDLRRTAWAEDEFVDFVASIARRGEEDRWRRLPGLNQLSRRGLEMARRLAVWARGRGTAAEPSVASDHAGRLARGDRQAPAVEIGAVWTSCATSIAPHS